jgi:hypothetical protein
MLSKLRQCGACSRHVKGADVSCPFCGAALLSRSRASGKNVVAVAAGIAVMGVGLGCAYGLPPDYYDRDAATPDVGVSDSAKDAPQDTSFDAPKDVGVDAAPDVSGDAPADAVDAGG